MIISAFNVFYLLETQKNLWGLSEENGWSMIFVELIVFKSNPPILVFQLRVVPILSAFLALLLLPPIETFLEPCLVACRL